jgi:hypothetical protein
MVESFRSLAKNIYQRSWDNHASMDIISIGSIT